MQRETLKMLVDKELDVLKSGESNLIHRFSSLCDGSRRFANLIVSKAVETRKRVRQQQELSVQAMNRTLSLTVPKELERAKGARDAVMKLRDMVIDSEFDVEQLELRKRYHLKRGVSQEKLQVRPKG